MFMEHLLGMGTGHCHPGGLAAQPTTGCVAQCSQGHGWLAALAWLPLFLSFSWIVGVPSPTILDHGSGQWSPAKGQDGTTGPEDSWVPIRFTASFELGRWEGKESNAQSPQTKIDGLGAQEPPGQWLSKCGGHIT